MENCPNCGAATRPGARFCTKCGRRLTVTETASAEIPGSVAAAPSFPSPWTATASAGDPAPAREEPDPAARHEHASDEPSVAAEANAAEPPTEREEPPVDDDRPVWSTSPSGSSWSGAWPGVDDRREATAPETAELVPQGDDWPMPVVEPGRDTPTQDAEPSTAPDSASDEMTTDAAPPPIEQPGESLWDVLPAEDMPPVEEVAAPAPEEMAVAGTATSPDAQTGESGSEAQTADAARMSIDPAATAPMMALLLEIRDLVAGIARAGGPGGVDLGAVAVELASARAVGAESADRIADLRQVLADAQDRPRDLGTAVALADRLDAIRALVESHDRATAAIDRALATLLGDPDLSDDDAPTG